MPIDMNDAVGTMLAWDTHAWRCLLELLIREEEMVAQSSLTQTHHSFDWVGGVQFRPGKWFTHEMAGNVNELEL